MTDFIMDKEGFFKQMLIIMNKEDKKVNIL